MFSILYSEIVKLKRSLVFFVVPIAAFIPAFLSTYNAKGWDNAFLNNAVFWAILMGPAISSLFTGYVFSGEYHDKTINNLLAYPHAAYKFFIGKMFAVFILIASSLTISFLFTLILGFVMKIPNFDMNIVIKSFEVFLSLVIMELTFMPVAAFLTILSKNYILSTGVGVVTSLIGGVLASFEHGSLFPSTATTFILYSIAGRLGLSDYNFPIPIPSVISLALYLAIPLVVSIVYFQKMDVHSGS